MMILNIPSLACGLNCQNGGTQGRDCTVCDCPNGFTGSNCQSDIDECECSPCVNGQCSNLFGSFECLCNSGFTGDLCDERDTATSASAQELETGLSPGVVASKCHKAATVTLEGIT